LKDVQTEVPSIIIQLAETTEAAGGHALMTGGCVRDMKLGLKPTDYDIEVYRLSPEQVTSMLSKIDVVDMVGNDFSVWQLHHYPIDVNIPRLERKIGSGHRDFAVTAIPTLSIMEAARRRDFTFNAMAYDPLTGQLYDFFNGMRDLREKKIRHTSEKFVEDPLRVLRAMQLASRFEMTIADETAQLCKTLQDALKYLPIERIWGEFEKMFIKGKKVSMGLQALDKMEILNYFPEVRALKGLAQDKKWHPEGDALTHTGLVCDAAVVISEREHLSYDERMVMVLGALTHDIGKADTTETKTDGSVTSYSHAQKGAPIAEKFMKSIGTPLHYIKPVMALVQYHMDYLQDTTTDRSVRRLSVKLANAGTTMRQFGYLVEADHIGRPPIGKMPKQMMEILKRAEHLNVKDNAPTPILMGRHLIELGLTPGPVFGQILKQVFEAQLDGKIKTLDEAVAYAKELTQSPNVSEQERHEKGEM